MAVRVDKEGMSDIENPQHHNTKYNHAEMIEKYNLEAKMSAALKEAVRNLRAEAASKKLVTRGELAREFMRRGVR